MRVLIVSTSEQTGGGAIAAQRLKDALNQNGVKARMLVRDKQTDAITVSKIGSKIPKLLERISLLPLLHFKPLIGKDMARMWQADLANYGIDITSCPEYKEADIIHLHWINQGMLSLDCIEKMVSDGKRLVWTLHDEWPYLGVCHYRAGCKETECRRCHLLPGKTAHKLFLRKREIYKKAHITFVGCSKWITQRAQEALPNEQVVHINNCIPTSIFHPMDREKVRRRLHLPTDKPIVLFCSQKLNDSRKGMNYLNEALQQLPDVHIVRIGKGETYISNPHDMAAYYAAADVFVTPSLQDNLPNTIAEAMSCGTPCVGFNIGGIPEMIDHLRNGYVANYRDAADLAQGIKYVLSHDLRDAAAHDAAMAYGETNVAQHYIKIYESRE